jgi:RNA polymerase sigma-70 factor (ECF subfamily)
VGSALVLWTEQRPGEAVDAATGVDTGADDAALVAAARANPQAFTSLYLRYVQAVHRYCYLKLGNREAAEDATSEVFLKALSGLGGYRGGYFAGWLFRIAQHVVTDAQRRASHRRTGLPLTAAGWVADPDPPPDEAAIAGSEALALRKALASLPVDQRQAMELELAGLSNQEIAATLGRSPGSTRVLRFRAQQRLRTILTYPSDAPGRAERRSPC